jgi:hypothetical protein
LDAAVSKPSNVPGHTTPDACNSSEVPAVT